MTRKKPSKRKASTKTPAKAKPEPAPERPVLFKPAPKRVYGYYCLPVLAGENLVARLDFKAERKAGRLKVLSCRFEGTGSARPAHHSDGTAMRAAVRRYGDALALKVVGLKNP